MTVQINEVNESEDSNEISAISSALINARHNSQLLNNFPGAMPETLEDAYAVQSLSINRWDDEVCGWKVGGVPPAYLDRFSDKRLVGPIFKNSVAYPKEGETAIMPVFDGFAAVESEFVFALGETADQDRLFIGVEIASSPLNAINDMGPIAVICDFGNNRGLIVGPEIKDWQTLSPEEFEVKTIINDEVIGTKTITSFPGDALEALAFFRAHAAKNNIEVPVGTYISSGAITGVHETRAGATSIADFGPFGSMNIELVPLQGTE